MKKNLVTCTGRGSTGHKVSPFVPTIIYAMKLSFYILFVILTSAQLLCAKSGAGQALDEVYIHLDLKGESLKNAIRKIESKTNLRFAFKDKELNRQKKISLNTGRESLSNILDILLEGSGLGYRQIGNSIVITSADETKASDAGIIATGNKQEESSVKGKVTDSKGISMPGVSVKLEGTATRTGVTDAGGNYSFANLQAGNYTLTFTFIGFDPAVRTIRLAEGQESTISLALEETAGNLDEVVVVGYGTQRRSGITGAVSSVSSEKIKDLQVTGLDQALAGQAAGVQVSQTNGAPGGGVTVRVRGTGSISAGNEPLYVIDGYPLDAGFSQNQNPLNSINPNDIASIDVLKDASATAIYGSRGANGVVIITTKRGKEGPARINFDIYNGWQQVANKVEMLNGKELAELVIEARNNSWVDRGGNASDPNSLRPANLQIPGVFQDPSAVGSGTDWQNAIFNVAPMRNVNITASGGNRNTRYSITAGYLNQEGILINSGFKRYSSRVNVDADLSKKLKLGINLSPAYTKSAVANAEGHTHADGIINSALTMSPHYAIYNPDGSYTTQTGNDLGLNNNENPVALAREIDDDRSQIRVLGNINLELEIIPGLKLKTLFGSDLYTSRRSYFRGSKVGIDSRPAPSPQRAESNTSQSINWLSENTLTFNKTIAANHNITALLGYTAQKDYYEDNYARAVGFPNDIVRTLNAGQVDQGSSSVSEWSLLSYLARVNYDYKGKYLATVTYRRDGSSRFGPGNKWGAFPSASVGWRISEENFMRGVGSHLISELKIRASYGLTGNNVIGNYGHIGLIGSSNYVFGPGLGEVVGGLRPVSITNVNLSWEKNQQLDIGLDAGLFKNRLTLIVDYYNKITSDLLLNVPVPQSTGFSTALRNIGRVRNRGWEFTLNSRNFVNAFKWSTDFNISFNKNKVLALGPSGDPIISGAGGVGGTHITEVGKPVANFYGIIIDGIFQSQEEIDQNASVGGNTPTQPGDPKFRDINGDNQINSGDRTIMGNPLPDFTYGITNTFSFRGFDLSALIQGVQGNDILNTSRRYLLTMTGVRNQYALAKERWRSPQEPGNGQVPRAARFSTGRPGGYYSDWVEDGSYLRMRNITLGYNFPQKWVKNIFLQNARAYLSVQNAFTLTKYTGYNPEASIGGASALATGSDYGGYPYSRVYTIGFNIGF